MFIIDDMTLMNDAPADDDTVRSDVDLCVRAMQIMVDGTREQFEELVHPEACNRESKDEPPDDARSRPARVLRHSAVAARRLR